MNKLWQELQRLYFVDGAEPTLMSEAIAENGTAETSTTLELLAPNGMVRAMVVGFERAADWAAVARLYQGIQDDLALPAPAIAVSGRAGYQVWLSLAEGVPAGEAGAFLEALRHKYLADLPRASLRLCPEDGLTRVGLVPALDAATGKWSAFIDPTLGAMFVDEPGLELAPSRDRQADMLAGLASIKAGDFRRAFDCLRGEAEAMECPVSAAGEGAPGSAPGRPGRRLSVGGNYSDPASFLLAVMNDPSATARQRIKAAKALLPYFQPTGRP